LAKAQHFINTLCTCSGGQGIWTNQVRRPPPNQQEQNMLSRSILCTLLAASLFLMGCGSDDSAGGSGDTIVVDGSDTMVNLSQAWAEIYTKKHPGVDIQVSGGGSGVGINSLISGTVNMANSSRKMSEGEIAKFKENNGGKEPKEHIVGLDALAIYVHKDNPYDSISVEELADIYGDGGNTTKWSQMGKAFAGCATDEITRVSRQNNSGTYAYFREHVLGKKRDFKNGSIDQSGSKDVVTLVSKTPCAIGYSGLGYRTSDVKVLNVSAKKGGAAIEPAEKTARDNTYPISRPLFIYTAGEPTGALKDFIEWAQSPEGQKIVRDVGYVPLKDVPATTASAQ
jgi:phosphate transport system substrate-binding protein